MEQTSDSGIRKYTNILSRVFNFGSKKTKEVKTSTHKEETKKNKYTKWELSSPYLQNEAVKTLVLDLSSIIKDIFLPYNSVLNK